MVRQKRKKVLITLLAALLVAAFCVLPASAVSRPQRFYRSQLKTRNGIYLYDQLTEETFNGKKQIRVQLPDSIGKKEEEDLCNATVAFFFDYPEKYWIHRIASLTIVNDHVVEVKFNSFQQPNKDDNEMIQDSVNTVVAAARKEQGAYNQLRKVHDLLGKNICYTNSTGMRAYQITGGLVDNTGVCEAYAKSFKLIAEQLGYPTILVVGTARRERGGKLYTEPHMWNYVQIDGEWYAVDVTWSDKGTSTEFFLVGAQTPSQEYGGKTFSQTHVEAPFGELITLGYPNLSTTALI